MAARMVEYRAPYCAEGKCEVVICRVARGVTVTVAVPSEDRPLAKTEKVCWLLTTGAVKTPVVEICPPLADQRTAVSGVFHTIAVNCTVLPELTLATFGVTVMLIRGSPRVAAGEAAGETVCAPRKDAALKNKIRSSELLAESVFRIARPLGNINFPRHETLGD